MFKEEKEAVDGRIKQSSYGEKMALRMSKFELYSIGPKFGFIVLNPVCRHY